MGEPVGRIMLAFCVVQFLPGTQEFARDSGDGIWHRRLRVGSYETVGVEIT